MTQRKLIITVAIVTLLTGFLCLIALFATNPAQLGPLGVTGWFIGLWLALGGMLALVLAGVKRYLFGSLEGASSRFEPSIRQGYLASGWLVVLLALSSLSQLNPRDIILSLILVVLIEGYFNLR